MTTYYVSPTGSSGDGSLGNPWALSEIDFSALSGGDVVDLQNGLYSVSATTHNISGAGTKAAVYASSVTVKNGTIDAASSTTFALQIRGAENLIFEKVTFKGGTSSVVQLQDDGATDPNDGVWFYNCRFEDGPNNGVRIVADQTNINFFDCSAARNDTYGYRVEGASTANFYGCKALNNDGGTNTGDGFQIVGSGAVTLEGCEASDNNDDGFDFIGYTGSATVSGCTAKNNGGTGNGMGFKMPGNTTQITLTGCLSSGNDNHGFDVNGHTGILRYYNCTAENNDQNFVMTGASTSSVLYNNLSRGGATADALVGTTQITNSWDLTTVNDNTLMFGGTKWWAAGTSVKDSQGIFYLDTPSIGAVEIGAIWLSRRQKPR